MAGVPGGSGRTDKTASLRLGVRAQVGRAFQRGRGRRIAAAEPGALGHFLERGPGLGVRPQRGGGTMPGALVGILLAGERNGEQGVGSAPIGRRCRCVRG